MYSQGIFWSGMFLVDKIVKSMLTEMKGMSVLIASYIFRGLF